MTISFNDITDTATPTTGNFSVGGTLTATNIDNTVIGGTTPAAGTFTTITGQTATLKSTQPNFFTYSSVLTNAVWSPSNITVAATSAVTDPFGGTNAFLLTDNSTNGTHGISQIIQC